MNLLKALAAPVAAGLIALPTAASACDANFTLYNKTALPIIQVFVSPSDHGTWSLENFLGDDTIDPQASYDIDVNDAWTYNGTFDVRVDWGAGIHSDSYGVPLCDRDTLVVDPDGTIRSH